jgi:hypothetical protein
VTTTQDYLDARVDLDLPDETLVEALASLLAQAREMLARKPAVTLRLTVHHSGAHERVVEHPISPLHFREGEKDLVFPQVVQEILARELPPKIATNQRLVEHVTNELRKDPYWSEAVVELIKALKRKETGSSFKAEA